MKILPQIMKRLKKEQLPANGQDVIWHYGQHYFDKKRTCRYLNKTPVILQVLSKAKSIFHGLKFGKIFVHSPFNGI